MAGHKRILKKAPKKAARKKKEPVLKEKKEKTPFLTPQAAVGPKTGLKEELPWRYNQDRMVLQVRDPRWLHVYWEVKEERLEKLKNQLRDEFYKARWALRVYDVSYLIFNGSNANSFFDIHISAHADNWYIDTNGPGRSWCVDLGLLLSDGKFITILRSNTVSTPLDGPSWITDEEWMIPDDIFSRLYSMGGGSSPIGKARWGVTSSLSAKK